MRNSFNYFFDHNFDHIYILQSLPPKKYVGNYKMFLTITPTSLEMDIWTFLLQLTFFVSSLKFSFFLYLFFLASFPGFIFLPPSLLSLTLSLSLSLPPSSFFHVCLCISLSLPLSLSFFFSFSTKAFYSMGVWTS